MLADTIEHVNVRVLSPDQEILEATKLENARLFRWGCTTHNLPDLLDPFGVQLGRHKTYI